MSQIQGFELLIKGGTSDEAFQVQCFLWEREASVCAAIFNI